MEHTKQIKKEISAFLDEVLNNQREIRTAIEKISESLADHMMKVLLFSKDQPQESAKWEKDLARQFRDLNRKIGKKSHRITKNAQDRRLFFSELHFSAKHVMRILDRLTADAYIKVVENEAYKNLKISEPDNIDDGVFSTMGFALKDVSGLLGKGFELSFNGKKIINTAEGK